MIAACAYCAGEGGFDDGPYCGTLRGTCRDGMCGGCYVNEKCEACDGSGEEEYEDDDDRNGNGIHMWAKGVDMDTERCGV